MRPDNSSTVETSLMALDRHLDKLGPAGLLDAVATIDLPDHLWLAIQMMCLGECERDSIVQALLRFCPLDVVEFADGSVLLSKASQHRFEGEAAVIPALKQGLGLDAFVRPPFRPAPARRKALRLGR